MVILLVWTSRYTLILSLSGRLVVLPGHSPTMNIRFFIMMIPLLLFAPLFEVLLIRRIEHLMVIQVLFCTFLGFRAVFCLRNTVLLIRIITLNTSIRLLNQLFLRTLILHLASGIRCMGRAVSHGLYIIGVIYNSNIDVIRVEICFLWRRTRSLFLTCLVLRILLIWVVLKLLRWSLVYEGCIL